MSKIDSGSDGVEAIALSALRAQQARMRMIAENLANAGSTAKTPGGEPYRRQAPVFAVAKVNGGDGVSMTARSDPRPFGKEYAPGNPAADQAGYVATPNVDSLIEALDMKDAMRAYEANLNVLENQGAMDTRTLSLLKSS
jgi:flagellar basal-body rod protein FlgC